ncbi:PH and SEC7 domain-containing protein 1-like [Diaphorina citri]|uniref:PH and SEC7 domain-containing protein 1-like n=1 Tax=Diaphorina citri TaxID=121845 RepID=A0A3Q0INQ7_DIACI|nr:PH and SEC7 domain-containing protein 1-like [Diaphorina citri]XP_026677873.1 PH and SEC7 domain-containing protein 1-like [Diaphorina citri]
MVAQCLHINSCDHIYLNSLANSNSASDEVEDPQLLALAEGAAQLARSISIDTTGSDDSDVDSLQSFHFSPKAVDYPSALRLAKRLYHLEGFKKSDVSRHLSKK